MVHLPRPSHSRSCLPRRARELAQGDERTYATTLKLPHPYFVAAVLLLVAAAWLGRPSRAADAPPAARDENLAAELLLDLPRFESSAAPSVGNPLRPPATDAMRRNGAAAWLAPVREPMNAAHASLVQRETPGRASAAQERVVSALDQLIERLDRQCQRCAGGQGKKPPGDQQQPRRPSAKPGENPGAADRAVATQAGPGEQSSARQVGRLIEDVWGQLPAGARRQILQPLSERFMPEYAEEIEAYFDRLAPLP